ncbi:hypothetical protein N7453_006009 [Penicillium expansum]|nr:hypothetical protein N7453_006009 [Penicillium expansum]
MSSPPAALANYELPSRTQHTSRDREFMEDVLRYGFNQETDSANTWEIYSIYPIDTRIHDDATTSKILNSIWYSKVETRKQWPLELQKPMGQKQTWDGTEKIKLIWAKAKEYLV